MPSPMIHHHIHMPHSHTSSPHITSTSTTTTLTSSTSSPVSPERTTPTWRQHSPAGGGGTTVRSRSNSNRGDESDLEAGSVSASGQHRAHSSHNTPSSLHAHHATHSLHGHTPHRHIPFELPMHHDAPTHTTLNVDLSAHSIHHTFAHARHPSHGLPAHPPTHPAPFAIHSPNSHLKSPPLRKLSIPSAIPTASLHIHPSLLTPTAEEDKTSSTSDSSSDDDVHRTNKVATERSEPPLTNGTHSHLPLPPHRRNSLNLRRLISTTSGRWFHRLLHFVTKSPTSTYAHMLRYILIIISLFIILFMSVNIFSLSVRFWHQHFSSSCTGIAMDRFLLHSSDRRNPFSYCAASFSNRLQGNEILNLAVMTPEVMKKMTVDAPTSKPLLLPAPPSIHQPLHLIPNYIHYVYGLGDQSLPPFPVTAYLAMMSAFNVQRPERIYFHYHLLPTGPYWDKVVESLGPTLILHPLQYFERIFGQPVYYPVHKTDIVRLEMVQQFGGIYLDLDMVLVRPLDHLRRFKLVLGEELLEDGMYDRFITTLLGEGVGGTSWYALHRGLIGLTNSFIASEPQSGFLQEWIREYYSFQFLKWDEFACQVPLLLSQRYPDSLVTLPSTSFAQPSSMSQLHELFNLDTFHFDHAFMVQLWPHITLDIYFKEATLDLSEYIHPSRETSFSRLVKVALAVSKPDDLTKPTFVVDADHVTIH